MTKEDPTQAPAFKATLGNLLRMKPKPHTEMKIGSKRKMKKKVAKKAKGRG